jgi:hypothetical protein
LTKTICCNNWICDDEHSYKISPMQETVVIEIMIDILSALAIIKKNIKDVGKILKNVKRILIYEITIILAVIWWIFNYILAGG